MTKACYKVPTDALALTKKYSETAKAMIAEKERMEHEYLSVMAAHLQKVQDAKLLACNAAAALLGVKFGPEDLYDIDVSYLDSLGIAVLQHIPAEDKLKPVATEKSQIN